VREGHDPQLEKAVEVVMEMLKKNPSPVYKKPAYPNYHQQLERRIRQLRISNCGLKNSQIRNPQSTAIAFANGFAFICLLT